MSATFKGVAKEHYTKYGLVNDHPLFDDEALFNFKCTRFKKRKAELKRVDRISIICLEEMCKNDCKWINLNFYNHWNTKHYKRHHQGQERNYQVVSHLAI